MQFLNLCLLVVLLIAAVMQFADAAGFCTEDAECFKKCVLDGYLLGGECKLVFCDCRD